MTDDPSVYEELQVDWMDLKNAVYRLLEGGATARQVRKEVEAAIESGLVCRHVTQWKIVGLSREPPRCEATRGPHSKTRCEMPAGHGGSHGGRSLSGRWFFWVDRPR